MQQVHCEIFIFASVFVPYSQLSDPCVLFPFQRMLPALARVKQARVPNAYDKTALKLEVSKRNLLY